MHLYTCSKIRSRMMKCGPSHTTTCTCRFEADVPWGKIVTLMVTLNQHSNSTQNQPLSRKSWSHRQLTRW